MKRAHQYRFLYTRFTRAILRTFSYDRDVVEVNEPTDTKSKGN